ncbi:MAG: hypothetical protein HGA65_09665 [Oscillochloris sp.]|nr:hypothetical protein [Oscillochloris sp.]
MSIDHESTLLGVRVGERCYMVAQSQVNHIGLLDPYELPTDSGGRQLICRELGPLLHEAGDDGRPGRRHAMLISLRRRSVALLVDRIDSLVGYEQPAIQTLSPLLTKRLVRPWFLGVVVYHDEPILLLDLRRIATDVAIGAV